MLHTKRVEHSPGRIICQKFLQSGCVETFIEVFNLMQSSRSLRREAEINHERCLPELLEDQLPVLKTISGALGKAERSRLAGSDWLDYELRFRLGHTFSARKEDIWLAEYFYLSSYKAISRAGVKDGRKMIQALERLGYIKEGKGQMQEALNLLEEAFELAEEHGLEMTDVVRQSLYLITHRICMTLGISNWEKEQTKTGLKGMDPRNLEAFKYFKKAQEMAVFADTKESQAAAHIRIGEVMLSLNKCDAAIRHFETYVDLCEKLDDELGVCTGHLALSSAYEALEDPEVAMRILQECVKSAVERNFHTILVPCYISMGKIETDRRNYDEAYQLFQKAFAELREHKEEFVDYVSLENLVRVLCGVGRAHLHLGEFQEALRDCTVPGIIKVLKWKSSGLGFGDLQIPAENLEACMKPVSE